MKKTCFLAVVFCTFKGRRPSTVSVSQVVRGFIRVAMVAIVLVILTNSTLAAKIAIFFDGEPTPQNGTRVKVTEYFEGGIWFRPISPSSQFGRVSTNVAGFPIGTSAYINADDGESLTFSFTNGANFDFRALTLAEYGTNTSSVAVQFIGYRQDGSQVSTTLHTDPNRDRTGDYKDFQIFYLDYLGFTNLIRVEIPMSGWSIDTLAIVPRLPPTITAISISNTCPIIEFRSASYPGTSNFFYSAEYSTDLLNWADLPNGFVATDGGIAHIIDTNAVGPLQRFYRIRMD
jgi:hypothetical protein